MPNLGRIKNLEILGDYNRKFTKWEIAIPELNKNQLKEEN
jgi:hypothetical protein